MTKSSATRCCGLALVVGAALPVLAWPATQEVPGVPDAPVWVEAWNHSFDAPEPLFLSASATVVVVSGPESPMTAHAADDGRQLWSLDIRAVTPPTLGEDLLFLTGGDQLRALDATTGREQWRAEITGVRHSPATAAGRVVIVTEREVAALDAATGDTLWRRAVEQPAVSPVVAEGVVYVGSGEPRLSAFDLKDGAPGWTKRLDARPSDLTASAAGVFFGGADGASYAYRARDGRLLWRFPVRSETIGRPVADEERVYVAYFDNTVRAFDLAIGNLRWLEPLADRPMAGLLLAGDQLILPTARGDLLAVARHDGREGRLQAEASNPGIAFEGLAAAPGDTLFLLTSSLDVLGFRLSALRREVPELRRF